MKTILISLTILLMTQMAGAQNILQVEGQAPVELPSMTSNEIREMEAKQRANQPIVVHPPKAAPSSQPKIIVLKTPAPAAPTPNIKVEINQDTHRPTPYPYHFEMVDGSLRKIRDGKPKSGGK